jgi:NADPH:quinone reductase-like Zn-dependent oxidoreductase
MMKAVRIHDYGTAEVLCYEDAPTPDPGPREIRSVSSQIINA